MLPQFQTSPRGDSGVADVVVMLLLMLLLLLFWGEGEWGCITVRGAFRRRPLGDSRTSAGSGGWWRCPERTATKKGKTARGGAARRHSVWPLGLGAATNAGASGHDLPRLQRRCYGGHRRRCHSPTAAFARLSLRRRAPARAIHSEQGRIPRLIIPIIWRRRVTSAIIIVSPSPVRSGGA